MSAEIPEHDVETPRLPRNWHSYVRTAVLNVVGVVRIAMLAGREALIENGDVNDGRIHQLETEVAMLREALRIMGARMKRVPPHRRPQYTTVERMGILQRRAMRGWNKSETGRHFFVSDDTIRAWLRRADDESLVDTHTPVNRFPDFVRYAIQQIKLFCPTLGKVKIADMLARAGTLDVHWEFDDCVATWEHHQYGGNNQEKARIGCYFFGSKGVCHVGWGEGWTFYPLNKNEPEIHEDPQLHQPGAQNVPELWANSIDAIEKKRRPICDIEIGHHSTTLSLLGMLSWKLGRSVKWDGEKEECPGDEEANKLLRRDYRAPWQYPAM